jgi:hypothetical protein
LTTDSAIVALSSCAGTSDCFDNQLALLAYVGDPTYRLDTLRVDPNRFTFLPGGSDGEDIFGPDQP